MSSSISMSLHAPTHKHGDANRRSSCDARTREKAGGATWNLILVKRELFEKGKGGEGTPTIEMSSIYATSKDITEIETDINKFQVRLFSYS